MKRRRILRPERLVIWREQNCRCPVCGLLSRERDMELDHIKRLRDGGTDSRSNLRLLCQKCHRSKTRFENTHPDMRGPKRDWRRFVRSEQMRVTERRKSA